MKIVINKVYQPLRLTEKRFIEIYGGRRSGKSWAIAQILLLRALSNSKRRILVLRKVGRDLEGSVWELFIKLIKQLGIYQDCKIKKSPFLIVLSNGAEIRFRGLDDPERSKSIETISDIWMEEATEFTLRDLETLNLGLSPQDFKGTIWLSHNPIPRMAQSLTWIEDLFLNRKKIELGKITEIDEDTLVLKTTYLHNELCPPAVIKELNKLKETNPELYRMWALGEYVEIAGVILKNWDIVDSVPEGIDMIGHGLDFGFSIDPVAGLTVWKHNNDVWIKPIIYQTELTNQQTANELKRQGVNPYDEIRADAAEPKSIQEIKDEGFFNIKKCQKHANYKYDAAQMLRGYNLHIVGDCPAMVSEFSTWSYQKDKNGKDIPKVTDGNDHYIDALIYILYNKVDTTVTFLDGDALGI